MRLLVYNIAYGTGSPAGGTGQILTLGRYLHTGMNHLQKIRECIRENRVDVAGLLEVDQGSIRTGFHNQAFHLSEGLGFREYSAVKYAPGSRARLFPILRKQSNSFLIHSPEKVSCSCSYFPVGMKRLILEIRYAEIRFILLHLALERNTRRQQLAFLRKKLRAEKIPTIVAGDLNTFQGEEELYSFCKALNLRSANLKKIPTYPSWSPRYQLDHNLCSEEIRIHDFQVLNVRASDHLPLLLDFTL